MNNPNRLIHIAEGDMPWGIFAERARMENVFWYEPQGDLSAAASYHHVMRLADQKPDPLEILRLTHGEKRILERFVLPNGVHYALILDAQTDARVLESKEFKGSMMFEGEYKAQSGEPEVIRGTDLGNGHILQMFVTHEEEKVWSVGGKDNCTSFVQKKITDKQSGASHKLNYKVDPIQQTLRLGYEYEDGQRYSHTILRPHIEPTWGTGHEITFGVNTQKGVNNGQLQLEFDQEGRLSSIYMLGKRNILSSGTAGHGISYCFEGARQESTYIGDQLLNPEIHNILETIFQITYKGQLLLDVGRSTNNMFANIDAEEPDDPRFLLVFNNSSPLYDASLGLENIS